MTKTEIEEERLHIARYLDLYNKGNYKPGTFGYHEALHTAYLYISNVETYLLEHPAIILDKEAYRFAKIAANALYDLYTHLGKTHL